MAQNRAKRALLTAYIEIRPRRKAFVQTRAQINSPQGFLSSLSRASWSKLGGGRLRRDCPELELARKLGCWRWLLVVRHHADELKDLLPAGDEARAQHVVHAEGLGGRGGRRGGEVRRVRKLLAQLQVVQNEPVAVVGYTQAVRGLAIGGGGKVGADPGGPVRGQKAVGQADFVDGKPGVALQVQRLSQVDLKVTVLAAVHVDRCHPFL